MVSTLGSSTEGKQYKIKVGGGGGGGGGICPICPILHLPLSHGIWCWRCIYPFIHISISIYPFIHLSIYPCIYPYIHIHLEIPFKPLFGNVYISIAKYVLLMPKRFVIWKNISHEKSWSGEGLLFMFHTIRITTFNSNCCYPQSET